MSITEPLNDLLVEIQTTLLDRHAKYGSRNIAGSPGGPLNGIRVRVYDKMARLNNYLDNGAAADFADDKLRDSFIDIAGYAMIGALVLDGKWPE